VSQDAAILDESVAENLRFARPEATEEDIWNALKRAKAMEFVESLPNGLETRLGERGTKLSGGQKQRLSLARALLQDTPILILDEPTSALDSETEQDIQRAINDLREGGETTILIIAHRLSTIRHSDKIVVMAQGRIIEEGSHKELMVSDEWYAKVSGMQAADST
jgi:ABC-type multidrug transport system fused ATPase/permease subunit